MFQLNWKLQDTFESFSKWRVKSKFTWWRRRPCWARSNPNQSEPGGDTAVASEAQTETEMEEKLSSVARNLTPSPIQQLSQLAQRCNAINLAEGFPDFPAPPQIKSAAISAISSDFNQYRSELLFSSPFPTYWTWFGRCIDTSSHMLWLFLRLQSPML